MSRDEEALSPTYLAMGMRRQWSDYHLFEPNDLNTACSRCGKRWNHHDHVTKEEDRAEVRRWADRIRAREAHAL